MTKYQHQQTTSSAMGEVSYWLSLVHKCTETEEQRYCYIRVLEIDERHLYAKQRLLDLRNGPARMPKAIQTPLVALPPLVPLPPKRLYEEPEEKNTEIVVDDKVVITATVIFLIICITIAVIKRFFF